MGKIITIFLVVGLLAGAGFGYVAWQEASRTIDASATIPTHEVTRGPLEVTVTSIGQLMAARSAVINAPYEARITRLIEEGTRVEEGDPIVWFETDDIEEQLEDTLAQLELDLKDLEAAKDAYELEQIRNEYTLETERTRVEIARQEYEDARQKYEAEQVLFDRNVTPATRLAEARLTLLQRELGLRNAQIELAKVEENLESNLRVRERAIESQRLRVENTERRVREAEERLEQAILTAPAAGEVSYLRIWKSGQVAKVAEGDTIFRRANIVEIPDTSEMMVSIPINEIDIGRVQVGQRAEVQVMAIDGQRFPAKVALKSIAPISDASQRSWSTSSQDLPGPREFEVRVRLDEPNRLFRQGMTASVRIILNETEDDLIVPLDAIFEREGQRGVFVQNGSQTSFRRVDVLMSGSDFAAVRGDLEEGERILMNAPTSDTPVIAVALAEIEEEIEEQTGEAAAPEAPADAPQQGGAGRGSRAGGAS